jgi:hypothetical protein
MLKFRRTITIIVIALVTCQSVMAGVGKHIAYSSNGESIDALQLATGHQLADSNADLAQPGTADLIDGDCCHAYGHCHLLAFTGQVANVSMPHRLSFNFSHTRSYNSVHLNTLLRPPTTA